MCYCFCPMLSPRLTCLRVLDMAPGSNEAAKRFMRQYDKFTIVLCTTAAIAYGAARYYDLPEAPADFDLKTWFIGGYDERKGEGDAVGKKKS